MISKTATENFERSGNFLEIFNEFNNSGVIDELQRRYSNSTFSIAPETLAKMAQNADYKNTLLREVDDLNQ